RGDDTRAVRRLHPQRVVGDRAQPGACPRSRRQAMKRVDAVLLLASALVLGGCATTSSTEVGVRTSLLSLTGHRGAQQVYPPGGIYTVVPFINSWQTLPISQQNLTMSASPSEGDRPFADEVTFKTRDGNNVH